MAAAPALIPGASGYAQAEVLANNAYNNALAQLNQNRLNTLTGYGYTGNIDPSTGVLSGVRVDPNAIHGQLQDLLHNQAVEDMAATQAAQDRGLVGGLAHQGAAELRFQHGSQDTALGAGLQQQLADYQNQQQDAAQTRDNALWQAEQDALSTELANQPGQTLDQLLAGGYGDPTAASHTSGGSGGGSGSGKGDSLAKTDPLLANARRNQKTNAGGPRRGVGKVRPGRMARGRALPKIINRRHGHAGTRHHSGR